jgi:membrane-bound lytic murein transglycosylase B
MNEAIASEAPAINEAEKRDVLGGLSMDVLLAERSAYKARIDQARARSDAASTDLAKAREALDALLGDRDPALDDELATAAEVADERVEYEEARVLATVEGVEFPLVALDAYYRAADTAAEERPHCGVEWWGLAGISRVEGRHGTYGGSTLLPNGDTDKKIIGIQLNGTNQTAVIADSDGGSLDGDAAYDRAVGPMQFIPQTWKRFGADGNDDGDTSPWNLYDAALAAANYLCTASSGLSADAGLRRAYFAYNHSQLYVDSVLGYARGYERAVEVPQPEA